MADTLIPAWLREYGPDADRLVPKPEWRVEDGPYYECRLCGTVYHIDESHGRYDAGEYGEPPSCDPGVLPPIYKAGTEERQWFVVVWSVGQAYGGPEEGGWWYTVGDLEKVFAVSSQGEGERLKEELKGIYPSTGKQYSVLGGEDWQIGVTDELPSSRHFPEKVPHYE